MFDIKLIYNRVNGRISDVYIGDEYATDIKDSRKQGYTLAYTTCNDITYTVIIKYVYNDIYIVENTESIQAIYNNDNEITYLILMRDENNNILKVNQDYIAEIRCN